MSCRVLTLLLAFVVAEAYAQSDMIFNSNYISLKPINYLLACPNIQFGIKRTFKDSNSRRKFSEICLTYPYGKSYYENVYSTDVIKKFQLIGLQVQWLTKVMNRRKQEKNKFWGPVLELDYINSHKVFVNNYTGFNTYDENYLLMCLGFHNGKFIMSKSRKYMQAFHWGAAIRFVVDFAYPGQRVSFGPRNQNLLGLKVYLSWQLGRKIR